MTGHVLNADGSPMISPVRCRWCGTIHDGAHVTVVQRYADSSVWRCPGCETLIDDRPNGWGGSYRVETRGGTP